MTFIPWAAFYEGATDADYFDQLIPRVMEDIIARRGTRNVTIAPTPVERLRGRGIDEAARQACKGRDAFHLCFVHADTGGRITAQTLPARSDALCQAMQRICDWPPIRCVAITPLRETEAWVLSDPGAVLATLGHRGPAEALGLPNDARIAERLVDPKETFNHAIRAALGTRRMVEPRRYFPMIAVRQNLSALRLAESFRVFEARLTRALADLGCVKAE